MEDDLLNLLIFFSSNSFKRSLINRKQLKLFCGTLNFACYVKLEHRLVIGKVPWSHCNIVQRPDNSLTGNLTKVVPKGYVERKYGLMPVAYSGASAPVYYVWIMSQLQVNSKLSCPYYIVQEWFLFIPNWTSHYSSTGWTKKDTRLQTVKILGFAWQHPRELGHIWADHIAWMRPILTLWKSNQKEHLSLHPG